MTEANATFLSLSAIKTVTVLLGLVVIYLGAKAWRASGRRPLFWLTAGMALMTLGAVAEGIAFQGLGLDLDASHIIEGFFTLAAFAVLVYSLYGR